MSTLFVHLSDIHIKEKSDQHRPEEIFRAITSHHSDIDGVFIVATGDVSYSGLPIELQKAKEFLTELQALFFDKLGIQPSCIVIPGNHDCSFVRDTAARRLVLANLQSQPDLLTDPPTVNICLEVQSDFIACYPKTRIYWAEDFTTKDGIELRFQCLNTAFASSLNEQQSALVFPVNQILKSPAKDIIVSLLHHPYNWLEAGNARLLRGELEKSSDIILTGHEHDGSAYIKKGQSKKELSYIEGRIFHDEKNPNNSGFYVVEILPASQEFRVHSFSWEDGLFKPTPDSLQTRQFIRRIKVGGLGFEQSKFGGEFLADPGMSFTHHAKAITFDDIFVAPSLRLFKNGVKEEGPLFSFVQSDNTVSELYKKKYGYITGDSQSGKTALAKQLYISGKARGLVPIIITGSQIGKGDKHSLSSAIKEAYGKQYDAPIFEQYLQMAKIHKVLIIDDFHKALLNKKTAQDLCLQLERDYEYAFLFGGESSQAEELIFRIDVFQSLEEYSFYEIIEFGPSLRERLVDKWLLMGGEVPVDEQDYEFQKLEIIRTIETALGKKLVPYHPINILMVLQLYEVRTPLSTASGLLGYFYEAVITNELLKPPQRPEDVDMKYTYLSEFAWHLFSSGSDEISDGDLRVFNSEYSTKFLLSEKDEKALRGLEQLNLLIYRQGSHSFHYPYLYYYFIARYMKNNPDSSVLRAIDEMVANIHREDCANIIIFYTYLSHDVRFIQKLINAAKETYKDIEPCNLESHIEFINRLQAKVPEIFLPEGEPEEHKRDWLKKADEEEEAERNAADDKKSQDEGEEEDKVALQEILAFNKAMKNLQVLGQIARNFSGSLTGAIKVQLVEECFAVSLRALNVMYKTIEKYLDPFLFMLTELPEKKEGALKTEAKIEYAKGIIFGFSVHLCLGIVRRIAEAVGSPRLLPTLDEIRSRKSDMASEFVQTQIRIENQSRFPESNVFSLYDRVKDKVFPLTILRSLIAQHFYLFNRPPQIRQKVINKIGISIEKDKEMLAKKYLGENRA